MKPKMTLLTLLAITLAQSSLAQDKAWKDGWKPSSTNIAGQQLSKDQFGTPRAKYLSVSGPGLIAGCSEGAGSQGRDASHTGASMRVDPAIFGSIWQGSCPIFQQAFQSPFGKAKNK